MIRACLTLVAAAATLIPAAAHAQAPCSLLTPDQIKAILNSPVEPGQPGVVAKDANDCTWSDANGEDRVYIALLPRAKFQTTRAQIEKAGGNPTSVTGVGEDAFFVSSQQPGDTSSALYILAKNHFLILTVTGPAATQQSTQEQNLTLEKTLAAKILPQL